MKGAWEEMWSFGPTRGLSVWADPVQTIQQYWAIASEAQGSVMAQRT